MYILLPRYMRRSYVQLCVCIQLYMYNASIYPCVRIKFSHRAVHSRRRQDRIRDVICSAITQCNVRSTIVLLRKKAITAIYHLVKTDHKFIRAQDIENKCLVYEERVNVC